MDRLTYIYRGRCFGLLAILILTFFALASCQQSASDFAVAPITLDDLNQTTYIGLFLAGGRPVQLTNGRWEKPGDAEGGAEPLAVRLSTDRFKRGDIDGDGADEVAVLLEEQRGDEAPSFAVAIVDRAGGEVQNTLTVPLGNSVRVRSIAITPGGLKLGVIQPGDRDEACCPGDVAELSWAFTQGQLIPNPEVHLGRVSLSTLGRRVWNLMAWDRDVPADGETPVTLAYVGAGFTGNIGCATYRAPVTTRRNPGEVKVGEVTVDRVECAEMSRTDTEMQLIAALSAARSFDFALDRLLITYGAEDEEPRVLELAPGSRL